MSEPAPLLRHEDAPRWLLLLVVLALVLTVTLGFRWIHAQPDIDHLIGKPPVLGYQGPIATVDQILDERTPANLVGREVALPRVQVQQAEGDYSFWIGPSEERRIPVLLFGELTERQASARVDVSAGQQVQVFGIVRDMREFTAFDIDPLLTEEQLEAIRRQPVFISARRVMTETP